MSEHRHVTARCPAKRRHKVAELVTDVNGHRVIHIPRLDVVDVVDGLVRRDIRRGGTSIDLDDDSEFTRWDQRHVACGCGMSFLLSPTVLLRAWERRKRTLILTPKHRRYGR